MTGIGCRVQVCLTVIGGSDYGFGGDCEKYRLGKGKAAVEPRSIVEISFSGWGFGADAVRRFLPSTSVSEVRAARQATGVGASCQSSRHFALPERNQQRALLRPGSGRADTRNLELRHRCCLRCGRGTRNADPCLAEHVPTSALPERTDWNPAHFDHAAQVNHAIQAGDAGAKPCSVPTISLVVKSAGNRSTACMPR